MNELQKQADQSQYGAGDYIPPVRTTYWSMRIMAYAGTLVFLVLALGRVAVLARDARIDALVPVARRRGDPAPVLRGARGLGALRGRAAAVDRVGPAEDGRCQLAERLDARRSRTSLGVFVVLYVALLIVDFVLMRRYARVDPPEVGGEGDEFALPAVTTDGSRDLLVLPHRRRLGGYFLLEGFDFGVGHAAPVRPARGRGAEHDARTIGPVWDGNEVWLVVAGGATFAAFPAWYATMFSGFYLALLLILFFLIVRVVSFEWRSKSETPRWRATWTWANTIGSFGAPLLWGIALSCLVYGVPDRLRRRLHRRPPGSLQRVHACSPESRSSRCSRSTARRSSRCARRASCARAPSAAARRLAIPAAVARRRRTSLDGRRRDRPQRQGSLPAGRSPPRSGSRRSRWPSRSCSRGRSGRAFAMTALGSDRRSSRRSSRACTRA